MPICSHLSHLAHLAHLSHLALPLLDAAAVHVGTCALPLDAALTASVGSTRQGSAVPASRLLTGAATARCVTHHLASDARLACILGLQIILRSSFGSLGAQLKKRYLIKFPI